MAALDRLAGVEVHAERGAEERLLDVVDRERIARQHDVHVAVANQLLEVGRSAGVHHHRSGDDGDSPARVFDLLHHRRDAPDADLDAALG